MAGTMQYELAPGAIAASPVTLTRVDGPLGGSSAVSCYLIRTITPRTES